MSAPDAARSTAAAPAGARPRSPVVRLYPALGVPAVRLFWLGMLPGTLAWQMSVVAAPYAAFALADSATILGVVSLATGLPMLVLSLVGGVVADRVPRRRVLLMTQGALGSGSAILAVLALFGALRVWHLVALGVVQGVAFAFNMPARQAYLAELVGPSLVGSAVALNNAGMNFCRVAGPALAGVMLATPGIGVAGVFVAMTLMYGVVLYSLVRLPPRPAPGGKGRRASGWAQLVEGLRYIGSSRTLVALLAMAFLALFLGMPFQTLLPLFAERIFDVGAGGLGALMAATGVGALAGSLTVAALSSAARPARLQLGTGVGFGLALAGFALAPSFPIAVAALVLVGFLSSAYASLNNTLIVASTEPRLYGRVMSVYLLTFATMPLGAFPMAWLADQIGGRPTVAGAGILVAVAVAGIALCYRPYRGAG